MAGAGACSRTLGQIHQLGLHGGEGGLEGGHLPPHVVQLGGELPAGAADRGGRHGRGRGRGEGGAGSGGAGCSGGGLNEDPGLPGSAPGSCSCLEAAEARDEAGGDGLLEGGAPVDGHAVGAVVVGEELGEVVLGDDGLGGGRGHGEEGEKDRCEHCGGQGATGGYCWTPNIYSGEQAPAYLPGRHGPGQVINDMESVGCRTMSSLYLAAISRDSGLYSVSPGVAWLSRSYLINIEIARVEPRPLFCAGSERRIFDISEDVKS